MKRLKQQLISSVLSVLLMVSAGFAEDAPFAEAAARLEDAIRTKQLKRIGVLPLLLEDVTLTSFNTQSGDVQDEPQLFSSPHTRLYADQLQTQLAERNTGEYQLIDFVDVVQALRAAFPDLDKFRGSADDVRRLSEQIEGGLDGVVIGTIRDRPLEADSMFSIRDVTWKLFDVAEGTLATAKSRTSDYSLADEIYNGRSLELYRWQGGRLWALGYGWMVPPRDQMPFNPLDSLDLYRMNRNDPDQPNPILNSNCPYTVKFTVDNEVRQVVVPVSRESRPFGNAALNALGGGQLFGNIDEEGLKEFLGIRQPQNQRRRSHRQASQPTGAIGQQLESGEVYLPLNPGESLRIHVTNKSEKPVLVAVFVDGINILGKKREIPGPTCRVWHFQPDQTGVFSGWYTGEAGQEQVETFVVTPWEDSVAAKLGATDRVRTITLVYFTVGWPDRRSLAVHPRAFLFSGFWDPTLRRIRVLEEVAPPNIAASPMDAFAMGGKQPQPHPLARVQSRPQGAILAAMTVHYAPAADIPHIARERLTAANPWRFDESVTDGPQPFEVVKVRTNGDSHP